MSEMGHKAAAASAWTMSARSLQDGPSAAPWHVGLVPPQVAGFVEGVSSCEDRATALISGHLMKNRGCSYTGTSGLPNFARLRRGILDRVEHSTVFSVQRLICSFRGNTILDSHSDSLGANLKK